MAKETEIAESLKQISANLETINNTIKEVCTTKTKEAKKNEEREFLLKVARIQTYADKCHAILSARISFSLVVFSLIVIFYPFYIQATLQGNPFSISGLVGLLGSLAIAFSAGIILYRNTRRYNCNIKRISDMYEAVRKGEDLPLFEKMDDWKANPDEVEKKKET